MEIQNGLEILHEMNTSVIYLMGTSFVLGSFFTLLLLALFDWASVRNRQSEDD
ncbi:MAG: hypothetical protein P8P30_06410 [Rickettsiales bacterium]|nr:hypothetical protein [Rickettsiales bacterium]